MLNKENIALRALEPEDLHFLFEVENNTQNWHVSDSTIPFSKHVLEQYIAQSHLDLLEAKQYRFVIDYNGRAVGFLDLFDYNVMHNRAGVGIFIEQEMRQKGIAKTALILAQTYAKKVWNIHQLYAHIEVQNVASLQLFSAVDFSLVGTLNQWQLKNGQYQDVHLLQWLSS